jgi:hypothetical protein
MEFKDMIGKKFNLTHQYSWVESVRPEKLYEIRVKLKESGKVFHAINRQGVGFAHSVTTHRTSSQASPKIPSIRDDQMNHNLQDIF